MASISAQEFLKGAKQPITLVAPASNNTGVEKTGDKPGYVSKVIGNLKNTFLQGAQDAKKTVTDVYNKTEGQNANVGAGERVARYGSAVGNLAGTVAATAGGIIGSFIEPALPEDVKSKIGNVASYVDTKIKSIPGMTPEIEKSLSDVFNTVSLMGGNKAAPIIQDAAVTGVVRGAEATANAAGKATTLLGRVTKAAGEASYGSAITPTVQEAEKILAYKANKNFLTRSSDIVSGTETAGKPVTRAQTALQKGVFGRESDVGIQARRVADKLWNEKVAPAVEQSPVRIAKEELFSPAEARIAKTVDPTRKAALQDALDSLKEDYAKATDFSLKDAQKLKSELDKFTPEKIFKGKNVASEVKTLQNDMANAIRNKTYEALADVNIKKDYLDWANLHELQKIGVKAISEAGTKGGFGGFWSTMYSAATTPIKTIGGQILYRVGNKLEFIGQKGIKTFGQYLKSKGYR